MKFRRSVCAASVVLVLSAWLATGQTIDPALNALWGSDITAGELMAATDPGALAHMSERMKATKVTWASGPGRMRGVAVPTESEGLAPDAAGTLLPLVCFVGACGVAAAGAAGRLLGVVGRRS